MEWATHIDARAHLPRFHAESFESWFKKQPSTHREKKVVYYVDSYANFNNPSLGMTVFALLDHLGYEVLFPPQKESGMPAIEYGLLDKARSLARYNVRHLAPYAKNGIPIVCSSPAASYLLREGYGTFLEDENLPIVSKAVVDIAELLMEEYEKGNLHFKIGSARTRDLPLLLPVQGVIISPHNDEVAPRCRNTVRPGRRLLWGSRSLGYFQRELRDEQRNCSEADARKLNRMSRY